jgi:benzylsuccinate CoA-transferase BbsF subunit
VRSVKPDIIYLAMSMQGAKGPEHDYLGYGANIIALTGLQHLSGLPGREPVGTGTNYPDHVPNPCHAAFAVLAALYYRRRSGIGQYIDLAQVEPTVALLGPAVLDFTVNNRNTDRSGNTHPWMAPHGVYRCTGDDRWIAIAAANDDQWKSLCRVLGLRTLLLEKRWENAEERHRNRDALDRLIEARTREWECYKLMAALQSSRVPAGVVQNARDLVERDPQLAERGHWVRFQHAEMGEAIYNAPPFRYSDHVAKLRGPAPLLGENTHEICSTLIGLTAREIDELISEGVLK